MRFSFASVLALAASVFAQEATEGFNVFKTPASHEEVPAGASYDVKWTYNSAFPGTIKVELYGGKDAGSLQLLSTLASKYIKY